jgi:hypothetical protein
VADLGNVMMERVPTRRACRKNKQPLETATCIAGRAGLSGLVEEACGAGDLCGRQLLSRTAS